MSAKPRRRPRHRPSKRRNAARSSILVVDDEQGTVDVLMAVLSDAGFEAAGAANSHDALAKLGRTAIDLVLLDFVMPAPDGGEILRFLRSELGLTDMPVVLMSGVPESMVKRRCRGYQAFLRKPFSLDELLVTVERWVKPSRALKPRD